MKRGEIFVGAFIFAFGGITALLSLNLKLGKLSAAGPGFFPLLLGILLMLLSGIYIVRLIIQYKKIATTKKEKPVTKSETNEPEAAPKKKPIFNISEANRNVFFCFGSMIIWAFLVNIIGYTLSSFFILVALLIVLGMRKWYVILIISVLTSGGSYLLFAKLLNIPLPQGFIGI
jgi:putative tricarboxylic transport membrane protein